MTMTLGNDRLQRKNLSDQLDRLDSILDALSDGLNQAVASTVEEAVGKAVQVAVKEVLSNSELLRLLRSQTDAPPLPQAHRPRPLTLKEILANAWERSRAALSRWADGAKSGLGRVRAWVATKFWNAVGAVRLKANAFAVPFVDGSGGGDAFAAGYMDGLLQGLDAEGCLRLGSAVGASCVRTIGTTTGVFTRPELEAFLRANTLRIERF